MSIRHHTAQATLGDGTVVDLRPVHADDGPLLADGFERLSPRGRFMRFLAPTGPLTARQLSYLTDVDHQDHVAWGVLHDGEPIAVARFVRLRERPDEADVAVTVIDDRQGRGIGRLLIRVLAVSARAMGVATFHFDVLAENRAMLGMIDSLGGRREAGGKVIHALVPTAFIEPPEGVEGDLVGLLETARREARGEVVNPPGRVRATPS